MLMSFAFISSIHLIMLSLSCCHENLRIFVLGSYHSFAMRLDASFLGLVPHWSTSLPTSKHYVCHVHIANDISF